MWLCKGASLSERRDSARSLGGVVQAQAFVVRDHSPSAHVVLRSAETHEPTAGQLMQRVATVCCRHCYIFIHLDSHISRGGDKDLAPLVGGKRSSSASRRAEAVTGTEHRVS